MGKSCRKKCIEDVLKKIDKDEVGYVELHFTDLLGDLKSVTVPRNKIEEALKHGKWFDGSSIAGFEKIYNSDMLLMPDLSTYTVLPVAEGTARFICDVYTAEGKEFEGSPRFVLKKALEDAKKMGFVYYTGPEPEFFIFKKNGEKAGALHDQGTYFGSNDDLASVVKKEMAEALGKVGIDVETLHHEVAPGQHEIDFKYDLALKTADNVVTFKYILKKVAEKHGLHVTFMPKPVRGINGSGMHVHQSLFKEGKNAFAAEDGLSDLAKSFMEGQMVHARAMSAILNSTVNSYKRLVPGYEAATYICWANKNRSALIRVPAAKHESEKRIEIRCPDPATNPYLAFAVLLKTGLEGVAQGVKVREPVEENVFKLNEKQLEEKGIKTLPSSLGESLQELARDDVVKGALGEHAYTNYITLKKKEWDDFSLHVSDWELDHYLLSK